MIRYTPSNQLTLEGFKHPFDQELSPSNRWVKLAKLIPWDDLASVYARRLRSDSGRGSIDIRMVIGALIVKHKLGLDDRGTVAMISENIYLQYFCGLSSFQTKEPFHPTVFVDIRKRIGAREFDAWNTQIIEKVDALKSKRKRLISKQKDTNDQDGNSTTSHKGRLKIDATVANQKIDFPTDAKLLNRAREESERIIDILYSESGLKIKPRTYPRLARKEYMSFSKSKKKTKRAIRKTVGKQLRYLQRNLGHIQKLLDEIESKGKSTRFPSSPGDQKIYWVIQHVYDQQKRMYDEQNHRHPDRILNIYQPYVRPIPTGKQKAATEFGAKISASEVDGMTGVEHISWDNFNESIDLKLQVSMFKETYGYYPELLLADRIYLNRNNRKWLKEKGIRMVGKPLGRHPKVKQTAYHKRKIRKEQNQRNLIEGKFGQGKNTYGLNNIQAKRSDTSKSWIAAIFFVMNIQKLFKVATKKAVFYLNFLKLSLHQTYRIHHYTQKPLCQHFQFKLKPEFLNKK